MYERIYICHTFYHAYVSFLKELKFQAEHENAGEATLLLSTMSNNFGNLSERVMQTGVFTDCLMFNEKRETEFPDVMKYKVDTGSLPRNMINRIIFCRKLSKRLAPYIPVDLKKFKDIYVYCDSDPIGYYLNMNHIRYHAMEDGLNCLKNYDAARFDNRGCFGFKAFCSEYLNLIFIQNGYGRYCIDMEVNDISLIKYKYRKYVELNRKELTNRLTEDEKDKILTAFIADKKELFARIKEANAVGKKILVLTDPLCTLDIRERIFRDICEMFSKDGTVFIKPHPRDELNYRELFSDCPQFDKTIPMEMLNFIPGLRFEKVVAVLTMVGAIEFADEVIRLGEDFMDKYEDPLIHRQNEQI